MADQRSSDPFTVDPSPAPGGVGWRFAVLFALGVCLSLLVSLAGAGALGSSSRSAASTPTLIVVDNAVQQARAWRSAGVRGAVLVDATRDLGYLPAAEDLIPRRTGWPVQSVDLPALWIGATDRSNAVWVAARTGLARTVHYVLPAAVLKERIRVGRAQNYPGIAADGGSVFANDEGYVRYIDDELATPVSQPAVLNIDASYFVQGTPAELSAQLGDSLRSFKVITVDRAEDATDVPEAARARADEMARIIEQALAR